MLAQSIMARVAREPALLRAGLELFALRRPVVTTRGAVWVFSAAAVREVLARSHEFLPGVMYAPRIKISGGPCLLGVDHSPSYERERATLWRALANTEDVAADSGGRAVRRIDPQQIARTFEAIVDAQYLQAARKLAVTGAIDVGALIEAVLVRSFAQFYGVDPDAARSESLQAVAPGFETLSHWLRTVGSLIALPSPAPWGFEDAGRLQGLELSEFLLEQAEQTRPAPQPQFGSLMANLRAGGTLAEPADIARCVGVLMLAGTTTIKATTLALHELLRRRHSEGAEAVRAAQRGDDAQVFAYAQEALRFRPVFPFLARYCAHNSVLGADTPYETAIAAGTQVAISPLRAMFDPATVERPHAFIAGRPDHVYLHFGHEIQHTCIGRHLAASALRILLSRLLAERNMLPGKIVYHGAAIRSYRVEQEFARLHILGGYAVGRTSEPPLGG